MINQVNKHTYTQRNDFVIVLQTHINTHRQTLKTHSVNRRERERERERASARACFAYYANAKTKQKTLKL